jgi:hypothetical protein
LEKQIAKEMPEEVQNMMALTRMAPKDPGVAFLHSGSNDPGWECFVMGYADLKSSSEDQELLEQKAWEDCGICIMTNSAVGLTVWAKVFHAITYLKGWVSLPYVVGGGPLVRYHYVRVESRLMRDGASGRVLGVMRRKSLFSRVTRTSLFTIW